MVNKDFDKWNRKKQQIDSLEKRLFFHEGEVWWIHLGINIGFETNGKNDEFVRPVIILKRYNRYSFLALPLTTSKKMNKYKLSIGTIDSKEVKANLSQLRNIDSKRLVNRITNINSKLFIEIKEKVRQVNFD